MKYISINKVNAGAILARDVIDSNGNLLLKLGIAIDDTILRILKNKNIESLCVTNDENTASNILTSENRIRLSQEIRKKKKKLFKYSMTDSMMTELYEAVVENEVWERWYNEQD